MSRWFWPLIALHRLSEAAYDRGFTLGERVAKTRLNVVVFMAGTVLWGACALTSGGVWWSQAAQVLLAMMFAFMLGATLFTRRAEREAFIASVDIDPCEIAIEGGRRWWEPYCRPGATEDEKVFGLVAACAYWHAVAESSHDA